MEKQNTVNVVEIPSMSDMRTISIVAFPETPEGNQCALARLSSLIFENEGDITDADMESYLAEGYFEHDDYWVGIVHSA